jgi:hypothetical protein
MAIRVYTSGGLSRFLRASASSGSAATAASILAAAVYELFEVTRLTPVVLASEIDVRDHHVAGAHGFAACMRREYFLGDRKTHGSSGGIESGGGA